MITQAQIDEERARMSKAEWIAIAALGVSILGGAFNIGVVYADLQTTKSQVVKLEIEQRDQMRLNSQINERLASMETNIEFLVDQARERRNGR
jgi:hypothetical protein